MIREIICVAVILFIQIQINYRTRVVSNTSRPGPAEEPGIVPMASEVPAAGLPSGEGARAPALRLGLPEPQARPRDRAAGEGPLGCK